ncbi:MAG TPA: hypothetical protein VHG28_03195 [Longimicrobiaceae bacterium]|nr:hypothetical protein [Longimicrobiaceae bacterium]
MTKNADCDDSSAIEGHDPVGIVVQDGAPGRRRPRAIAFVWGPEAAPVPSLPFGRWKTGELSAA